MLYKIKNLSALWAKGEKTMSKWLNNAVFYEIYPQSFNDTNGDGIGDFNGIIEKLDYIKELGCNAIWINPCFESPFGDAGYDVSDYCKAAPRYGTNEDLKRVFEEAHKRDMHVLLDLVPGHTSVEHKWFRESMKAEKNEFTDRYVWTDSIWEEPQGMSCIILNTNKIQEKIYAEIQYKPVKNSYEIVGLIFSRF